jgi:hypothetical protein
MKTPALRLSNKDLRDIRCGYLYDNGKLVLVHETKHPKAGTVEWVTIHETGISCAFKGRIILSRSGTVRLVLQSVRVSASDISVSNGSENTQRQGIAIGNISLQVGPEGYNDYIYIPMIAGLAGDWTYQPESTWTELEYPTRWAGYTVANATI